jgi:hypothetical protein
MSADTARRLAERAKAGPKMWTRNGYHFAITSCRADGNLLRLQVRVRKVGGPLVLDCESDAEFNELIIVNPRLFKNAKGVEDVGETIEVELDRFLHRKVGGASA